MSLISPLYHLPITGTVGLLLRAYREGILVSLGETLDELESSGFRLHTKLKEKLLKEAGKMQVTKFTRGRGGGRI